MQVLLLKMDNEEDEKGYKKVQFTHFLTYFLARMERKLEQYCKIKFKFVVERFHPKPLPASHTTSLTPSHYQPHPKPLPASPPTPLQRERGVICLVVDKGTRVRVNKLMGVSHFFTFSLFHLFTLKGREPSFHPFTLSPFHL